MERQVTTGDPISAQSVTWNFSFTLNFPDKAKKASVRRRLMPPHAADIRPPRGLQQERAATHDSS